MKCGKHTTKPNNYTITKQTTAIQQIANKENIITTKNTKLLNTANTIKYTKKTNTTKQHKNSTYKKTTKKTQHKSTKKQQQKHNMVTNKETQNKTQIEIYKQNIKLTTDNNDNKHKQYKHKE